MESKNKGRENSIGGDERAPGKGRRAVESSLPSKAKLRRGPGDRRRRETSGDFRGDVPC